MPATGPCANPGRRVSQQPAGEASAMAAAVESVRSPVTESTGRILGYDVARSLALLGMIVVHFGLVMAADPARPAWSAWIMHGLDGRAAATFVILAGVGLTLRSRRAVAS